MSDSLDGSIKVAGSDIIFTVQFDRQTDGIPLSNCTIRFKLSLKNTTILNLTTVLGLVRSVRINENTDDRQVVTGEIPAAITANITENSILKYNWSIEAQGRIIRDESYKGSVTIVGY